VAIRATMMALPITSAGRFSPLGPLGIGWHIHQCCNQSQECLLLWPIAGSQKIAQFNVRQPASRRSVGLVDNEGATIGWLAS
jgi:hypothetical protein